MYNHNFIYSKIIIFVYLFIYLSNHKCIGKKIKQRKSRGKRAKNLTVDCYPQNNVKAYCCNRATSTFSLIDPTLAC